MSKISFWIQLLTFREGTLLSIKPFFKWEKIKGNAWKYFSPSMAFNESLTNFVTFVNIYKTVDLEHTRLC